MWGPLQNLPLDVEGGIEWGLDWMGCMNPLRLALLAASPFCFAKMGGMAFFLIFAPANRVSDVVSVCLPARRYGYYR